MVTDTPPHALVVRSGAVTPPPSAPRARAAAGNGGGARHAIPRAGDAGRVIRRRTFRPRRCGRCGH